jgi:hypothetical protein
MTSDPLFYRMSVPDGSIFPAEIAINRRFVVLHRRLITDDPLAWN